MTRRRPLLLAAVLASLFSLGCFCSDFFASMGTGFNEGFCSSYPKSYLEGCQSTCEKTKTAAECQAHCTEALQTDAMYQRCIEK